MQKTIVYVHKKKTKNSRAKAISCFLRKRGCVHQRLNCVHKHLPPSFNLRSWSHSNHNPFLLTNAAITQPRAPPTPLTRPRSMTTQCPPTALQRPCPAPCRECRFSAMANPWTQSVSQRARLLTNATPTTTTITATRMTKAWSGCSWPSPRANRSSRGLCKWSSTTWWWSTTRSSSSTRALFPRAMPAEMCNCFFLFF